MVREFSLPRGRALVPAAVLALLSACALAPAPRTTPLTTPPTAPLTAHSTAHSTVPPTAPGAQAPSTDSAPAPRAPSSSSSPGGTTAASLAPGTAATAKPSGAPPISGTGTAMRRVLIKTNFADLPGWQEDNLAGLDQALFRQCASGQERSANVKRHPALEATCARIAELRDRPGQTRQWVETHFTPWAVAAAEATGPVFEGLITGYYEPLLRGARQPGGPYQTPIRARPDDLLVLDLASVYPETRGIRLRGRLAPGGGTNAPRVVPYLDRAQLEAQTSHPRLNPALAWVDDPVDAFFLEIQGSGRIQLEDGSTLRVGYADQNGHPYKPIGRELIRRGALPASAVTAPAIRQWLRENPSQAPTVMATNPSVVFFRELAPAREPDEGPPGAMGVPLTPTRSAAIDPQTMPLGAMLFIRTNHPVKDGSLGRAVVAQDTGGAIRGAVRADFFWGFESVDGVGAADLAGRMRSPGRVWLLWPRGDTPPEPDSAQTSRP